MNVLINDPLADIGEARQYYGVDLQPLDGIKDADAVILAVMHKEYREIGLEGISGVGISFGMDRIFDILEEKGWPVDL